MKRALKALGEWWTKHSTAFILGWWLSSIWPNGPLIEADQDILSYTWWALGIVFVGWTLSWWIFVVRPWQRKFG